jgi:hypothetical protein
MTDLNPLAGETVAKLIEVGLANLGRKTSHDIILAALRKAVQDEREACGHVAHNHGRYSQANVDDQPPPDVVTHNRACWAIRDAIRARTPHD